MTDTPDRAALEALVIDVEGADQDGALVGWEYTATGMRFTVRGALAAAITAQAERADAALARAERAEALNKEAKSVLAVFSYAADLLEVKATGSGYIWGNSDYRSWISSYFRPKAFASARALAAHLAADRTKLEPDA